MFFAFCEPRGMKYWYVIPATNVKGFEKVLTQINRTCKNTGTCKHLFMNTAIFLIHYSILLRNILNLDINITTYFKLFCCKAGFFGTVGFFISVKIES